MRTLMRAKPTVSSIYEDEAEQPEGLPSVPSSFALLNATNTSIPPVVTSLRLNRGVCRLLFDIDESLTSFGDDLSEGTLRYLEFVTSPTAEDVVSLKSSSLLTWSELAQLFGVSRRTVHNWANGAAMNSRNHQRLEVLSELIVHPRRSPEATREWLMSPREEGPSIFRYLVREASSRVPGPSAATMFAGSDPYLAHVPVPETEIDPNLSRPLPDSD